MSDDNELNLNETQKKLMSVLVSRTFRKYGVSKNTIDLSDEERKKIKETVLLMQEQTKRFIDNQSIPTYYEGTSATSASEEDK